jgi:hypothetical protein
MATTLLNDVLPYDQAIEPELRERLAVSTLRMALLLGVASDLLLRGGGLGVNALLLAALVAVGAWSLDRQRGDGATRARLPLLLPVAAAGLAIAWRDSEFLKVTAVMTFIAGVAIHAAAMRAGPSWSLWRLDALAPIKALLRLGVDAASQGGSLLARDIPPSATQVTGRWRTVASGWRGLLVALPLLLVLNALLMSADPIWEKQAARVLDVDVWSLVSHLAVTTVFAWLSAGWLRGALLATAERPPAPAASGAAPSVRAVDVQLPLVLVNLLFAGFVAVQLRTLVGGAEYVKAAAGLTFAEYARRGFFQLVFVAALTLPTLYAADAMTPLDHRARRSVHRSIAVTLLLLVGILASAAVRMALYTNEYGLTEDRFYASAMMTWLVPLLGWFALTVLRDRPERFMGGALVSAWGTWAALVALNPDATIARTNVARIAEGRPFDAGYVTFLSLDAAPTLVAALPRMPEAEACAVRRSLRIKAANDQVDVASARDWRTWTVARWRADRAWRRGGIEGSRAWPPCPNDLVPARAMPAAAPVAAPVAATPTGPGVPEAHAVTVPSK